MCCSGILCSHTNGALIDAIEQINRFCPKWRKPDTEDHILHDFNHMKCPDQGYVYRDRREISDCLGLEKAGEDKRVIIKG